ncbi:UDP-N-acetylmuramate dehydrogenase [Peptoniphilus sp. KCTC 25270]|uniref:UDP-N-acetylmuramate dehydrogenase n=1 Tax=Peptoniphilus sp. KCTC 25270 TaxID=2897414 RepID=UPI001E319AD2|nr:UDP-N-acetylmuramate dehydrogenase [Peptoniphilus sp. KCTC 25270]MCD1146717.1 UDP-N-acetylmuramate dehydrogenase [Peptoniphilus sp. KCTC 25270]
MNYSNRENVKENFPMKEITSFRIGGPVDFLIEPETAEELKNWMIQLKEDKTPYMVMGEGSNMLVSDKGLRGAVLRMKKMNGIRREGNMVIAESGATLKAVAEFAREEGLTGLEFAHGIPGSVGGAMTMNAGAYDGEMKDVVHSVISLDPKGNVVEYLNEDMHFIYRHSRVLEDHLAVLETKFHLKEGDKEAITEKMEDLWNRRETKQPLEWPSAGSTFKRPVGYFAGQLIDQAGLRGLRHGGAQVSEKHCGFVINRDNATCQDVVELIRLVQEAVRLKHGVELETEVKVLGE